MKHIIRMILGFALYWLVARLMPVSWWIDRASLFNWAVPHFGYYAYHPYYLPWYKQEDGL